MLGESPQMLISGSQKMFTNIYQLFWGYLASSFTLYAILLRQAGTEDASDFTRKMLLAKKVHIFRHLSEEQTKRVVESWLSCWENVAKDPNWHVMEMLGFGLAVQYELIKSKKYDFEPSMIDQK